MRIAPTRTLNQPLGFSNMDTDFDTLIDRIYEAALVPELWRSAIDAVCATTASATGSIICAGPGYPALRGIGSQHAEEAIQRYLNSVDVASAPRFVRSMAPGSAMLHGFSRFEDILSLQEQAEDPVVPVQQQLGIGFQIATVIGLPTGDFAGITLERWIGDGRHSAADFARIEALRPHLARAAAVSVRLGLERARSMVETLEAVGMPAAALTADGRALAVNGALEKSDLLLPGAHGRIVVASPAAHALFEHALQETQRAAAPIVRSIPVPTSARQPTPAVLHLVPVRGAAHDVLAGTALLLIATGFGAGAVRPEMPLLHGLFDLTPREAQLCTALAAGHTVKAAASSLGMGFGTARGHLEHIFQKTGTHRQAELVLLLQSAQPIATGNTGLS